MRREALTAILFVAAGVSASAQTPDFSGTWMLDRGRSRIAEAAGLAGLAAAGAPETLHVTHAANGTLVVESQINESHARVYIPGSTTSTPVTVGPGGRISMRADWQGRTLVSEGTRETASGPATTTWRVKEVFGLGADGKTLTIEVTSQGEGEAVASRLTYIRSAGVGPCQSWPTPCKPPPR